MSNDGLNSNQEFDLAGVQSSIRYKALLERSEQAQDRFNSNKDILMNAFEKAMDYRLGFIEQRQEEIDSTSKLDRMMGKGPEPIPTIAEVSLHKDEVLRHVPLSLKSDESFIKMVDDTVNRLYLSSDRNMGTEFWRELKPSAVLPDKVIEDYIKHQSNVEVESLKANLTEYIQQREEIKTFNAEKSELLSAFQQANNERMMSSIERDKEINSASWVAKAFGRVPEVIPSVAVKSLTREEILKHIDPKMAESETMNKMLDEMVERLEKSATGKINVDFLASVAETVTEYKTYKMFAGMDERIDSSSANSNYAAVGLDDESTSQYIQDRLANGEGIEWISAKLAVTNTLYNAWNAVTWGH